MLTYNARTPRENVFVPQPHPSTPCVQLYDPPTPEFAVARITVPQGSEEFVLPRVSGGCVRSEVSLWGINELPCSSQDA